MPTNRRLRRPQRRNDPSALTDVQRDQLCQGWGAGPDGPGFADLDEMAAAWELHGDEFVQLYVDQFPGRRPFGYWALEIMPEYGERPIVDPNVTRDQYVQSERSKENRFGILHTSGVPFIQEPEAEFLERHDQLGPGEFERALPWLGDQREQNDEFLELRNRSA